MHPKEQKDPCNIWLDCDPGNEVATLSQEILGLALPGFENTANMRPGHDDAFAIIFAACHPSINLLGVSTVHGNASLARTTQNAQSILVAVSCGRVSVHKGAAKPFCRDAVHAPDIHGKRC
jgi:inosine-uridine nucleoside N-ribohydrolase